MNHIFSGCKSLEFLPDISKWNTKSVRYMKGIFSNCTSLKKLPDISKWNTVKVEDLSCVFENCCSLGKIPDISKWNIPNVKDISKIFYNCSSLITLPDIKVGYKTNINASNNTNSSDNLKYTINSYKSVSSINSNFLSGYSFHKQSFEVSPSSKDDEFSHESKTIFKSIDIFNELSIGLNEEYYENFYN